MRDRRFLAPSFKSAFVMATLLITATLLAVWAVQFVVHDGPGTFGSTVEIFAAMCGALILATLFIILPAAILIRGLDARHFGCSAAIRWLAMGILLGLALSGVLMILPRREPEDTAILAATRMMARAVLGGGAIFLCHWLAFRAPPWPARHTDRDGGGELPSETETERQQ